MYADRVLLGVQRVGRIVRLSKSFFPEYYLALSYGNICRYTVITPFLQSPSIRSHVRQPIQQMNTVNVSNLAMRSGKRYRQATTQSLGG